MTKYRNHSIRKVLLSKQYAQHVMAMTDEALHNKGQIAEELAARDLEMERMRNRIEQLRGGLKSASGWIFDLGDTVHADMCLDMAGDMEPPLMGSNV